MPTARNTKEVVPADCPNHLLATWVHQWYLEAIDRGTKSHFTLRKACHSLIAHPTKLKSGREAEKLDGIGPFIAEKLERKIQAHIRAGGVFEGYLGMGAVSSKENSIGSEGVNHKDDPCLSVPDQPAKLVKPRAPKEYIPTFRSGPYAMLLALYHALEDNQEYLTKEQIMQKGQTHCSAVMDEGTFSAINGAITTLTKKSLIKKIGVPSKYSLTQEGVDLARKLVQGTRNELPSTENDSQSTFVNSQDTLESETATTPLKLETITWKANTYEIHLVMDNREVKSQREREFFADRLGEHGIPCEQRPLVLGDFAWVARKNERMGLKDSEEIVLDYIVERKRIDDFSSSITDGRFVEQKFRLNQSGISNVFYLIEKADAHMTGIPSTSLYAAMIQTEVIEGFFIKHTSSHEDTVRFLAGLTKDIKDIYKEKAIHAVTSFSGGSKETFWDQLREKEMELRVGLHFTYTAFSSLVSKSGNLTQRDLFSMQLLTIRQMSADKAAMIAAKFPTPISLYKMYEKLPSDAARGTFFKDWVTEGTDIKFGPALSKRIFEMVYK